MEITAKDVYIFANECLKIQEENIKALKAAYKDTKHKAKYKQAIHIAEEKKDFLENTKTIVLALYEKQDQTLVVTEEDINAFKKAYFEEAKEECSQED